VRWADQIWQAETDDAGYANFDAIPVTGLAELRIEITPHRAV
jgi:hypothetical protein